MVYDYLIVGAGLFGATLANLLSHDGKTVLVVEKNNHIGGTAYTEMLHGICVHTQGAHIFRTNDDSVWTYINSFGEFKSFKNEPLSIHDNVVYNLPFNMNMFSKLWDIKTPDEAQEIINQQIADYGLVGIPTNLEEHAITCVGRDIYEAFIKSYTEKQWGKKCTELPPSIMKRIPIRFTYDNNYYDSKYQGVPIKGYTEIMARMLSDVHVLLGIDGKQFIRNNPTIAKTIIYTGRIDELYDYEYGVLEYRSLYFDTKYIPNIDNFQGNAVVNYPDADVRYTRIIEHKHFLKEDVEGTIITKEYPSASVLNPYYPIETVENLALYKKYKDISNPNIYFGGRLGSYKYFDMDDTIKEATKLHIRLGGI